MTLRLEAPFPWFGGKSRASALVWSRLGADVAHYVEPFAGSLAVLLGRPGGAGRCETVNDADGFISNVWRAIRAAPEDVAHHADWPVSEVDLTARHLWLVGNRAALTERLQVDADYFDARAAGWWLWGISAWIGSGWCAGDGPWGTDGVRWTREGTGIHRQLPHLVDTGKGVHRQLPHLVDTGKGVHRKLPHLVDTGKGVYAWMRDIADRLRHVRVACGDWTRVVTPAVLAAGRGACGVLLDPPYPDGWDPDAVYAGGGGGGGAAWYEAAEWAERAGRDPQVRIALCGYAGTWAPPRGWAEVAWKSKGGYGSQSDDGAGRANAGRERVWFSPHCLGAKQPGLFGAA